MMSTTSSNYQLEAIRLNKGAGQKTSLNRALKLRRVLLLRCIMSHWKKATAHHVIITQFIRKQRFHKRYLFFRFWYYNYTISRINNRRRHILAGVIGDYAIKSRSFQRILRYNYNNRRIQRYAGHFDQQAKIFAQALSKLRNFLRIANYRIYFHRWHHEINYIVHSEIAARHYSAYLLKSNYQKWSNISKESAKSKRQEQVTMENFINFHKSMEEANEAVQTLAQLELDRKLAELEVKQMQKQSKEDEIKALKLNEYKREREMEQQFITTMQREERVKRVIQDMKILKEKFKSSWIKKRSDIISREANEVEKYILNPANKLEIEMKFIQLRKEFYAPPNFEYEEREKILRSYKNIVMLFLWYKVNNEKNMNIRKYMGLFDTNKKGYLDLQEAHTLLLSLNVPGISSIQLQAIVNEINIHKDEYITPEKLENAMQCVDKMGVPGSPWKFYIDPIQSIIQYRNFSTAEVIIEQNMTDKILQSINIANIRGEGKDRAIEQAVQEKILDWELTIKVYMANRIQYMYRVRKARKQRRAILWRVDNREFHVEKKKESIAMALMIKHLVGMKARLRFKRQLYLTIEKVWDIQSSLPFYYNHFNGTSSWNAPLLLRRYGKVEEPISWVAIYPIQDSSIVKGDEPVSENIDETVAVTIVEEEQQKELVVSEFYNIPARKPIPRKPDGFLICRANPRSENCSYFATRQCTICEIAYCFPCHRFAHKSPFDFFQNIKPTPIQRLDPVFMMQVTLSITFHPYTIIQQPVPCELCAQTALISEHARLAAYVYCNDCKTKMCRICSRRLHAHGRQKNHTFVSIE